MKFKYLSLSILSLSTIIVPAGLLISCSNNSISAQEKFEQENLIIEIIKNKFLPEKITIEGEKHINEINDQDINFNNGTDDKYKTINFEVKNIEIPEINAKDTKVNINISSKLDDSIKGEYFFNISEIITNKEAVLPMEQKTFNKLVEDKYLIKNSLEDTFDFSNKIIDLVNTEIKIGDFDITNPKNFENEIATSIFKNAIGKYINLKVSKELKEIFSQSNLSIVVLDIVKLKNSDSNITLAIKIGESSYEVNKFIVTTFSQNFLDAENDLAKIITLKIKPNLIIGEHSIKNPIKVADLFLYLNVEIPKDILEYNNFLIGFDGNDISEITSDAYKVKIIVSNKIYNDIFDTYEIEINDILGYVKGIINFE